MPANLLELQSANVASHFRAASGNGNTIVPDIEVDIREGMLPPRTAQRMPGEFHEEDIAMSHKAATAGAHIGIATRKPPAFDRPRRWRRRTNRASMKHLNCV